jgi:hypothetical protein
LKEIIRSFFNKLFGSIPTIMWMTNLKI